ncbi:MAG: hypothetical protein AB7S38_28355 [Vulcanimicrobiota bacterium]
MSNRGGYHQRALNLIDQTARALRGQLDVDHVLDEIEALSEDIHAAFTVLPEPPDSLQALVGELDTAFAEAGELHLEGLTLAAEALEQGEPAQLERARQLVEKGGLRIVAAEEQAHKRLLG